MLPRAPYSCHPSTHLGGCAFCPKGSIPCGSIWFTDLQDLVTEPYNTACRGSGKIKAVSLDSKCCWLSGLSLGKCFESDIAAVKFSGRIPADISVAVLRLLIVLFILGTLPVHLANMFKCFPG